MDLRIEMFDIEFKISSNFAVEGRRNPIHALINEQTSFSFGQGLFEFCNAHGSNSNKSIKTRKGR